MRGPGAFRSAGKIYGRGVPVITQSFASNEIRPGETWKVYLNAHDPDGDMKQIVCVIEQPGVGVYPAAYTRIKADNRKELSGYIYLTTFDVNYSSFNFDDLVKSQRAKMGSKFS